MAVMAKKPAKPGKPKYATGAKLTALRKRLGISQEEAVAKLGISLGTWRNWEQGRSKLDTTAIRLIELVLGKINGK